MDNSPGGEEEGGRVKNLIILAAWFDMAAQEA